MKKSALLLALLIIVNFLSFGQNTEKRELLYSHKFSVLFGTIQPTVLQGFNVEVNYTTNRMIFDYSHGVSLDPPAAGEFKEHNLALHIPTSTGFGIGYRFTSFFDLRFEPKLHTWEIYESGQVQDPTTQLKDFTTFTLGIGAYYRYMPFRNKESEFLQGITTSTSLRYWQNVGSTLPQDQFTIQSKTTNSPQTLAAPNIGMGNSPLIFNISIGYTFGGKN